MTAYINGLLMSLLRPGLASDPVGLGASQVGTLIPADYADDLPYVWARATPGGLTRGVMVQAGAESPLTRFTVPFQIDVYAAEGRDAHNVGVACLRILNAAVSAQTVTGDGYLSRVSASGPTQFPDPGMPDGVYRHLITGTLTARPSA